MFKIYGIKNCSSMKKAFEALASVNLAYEFHDYKKLGIDRETLCEWLEFLGSDVVVNKKGTTWRKLSEQQQQQALSSESALIDTLMMYPSLIKRPILHTPNGWLVGFDEQQYLQLASVEK